MDFRRLKLYTIPILLLLACVAFYFSFAYDLEREDFIKLIGLYAALFFLSFKLIQMQKYNFWILVSMAVIFRLIFIVALPNLSQDYFRFIWDGRLLANGWNPYEHIPEILILDPDFQIEQARLLEEGMGSLSAGNFTNYAPVNQLIFAMAGWLAPSNILFSVISLRIVVILADLGTLFYGSRLLRSFGLPEHRIFWYILNPFIIIELTGNLHFEGVMVFFLVWSIYLLQKGKYLWSAVVLGLSISVKLLPLMFLPLLLRYFTGFSISNYFRAGSKASTPLSQTNESRQRSHYEPGQEDSFKYSSKSNVGDNLKSHPDQKQGKNQESDSEGSRGVSTSHPERSRGDSHTSHPERSRRIDGPGKLILYYLLVLLTVVMSFLPFYSPEVLQNFTQSIALWFGKFEFNASIYYLVREIGYWVKGYNIIATAGKILPFITFIIILGLSLFRKNESTKQLITSMLFAITAYLFLSTTVHSWYLAIPLILSVFTEFRYVIAWTAVVMLTYFAYSNPEYQENPWLLAVEYIVVFGFMFFELFRRKTTVV